jgi:hypothetical protein
VSHKIPLKFFHHIIITTMDSYIIYNAEHKVLICRQHQYGIPPDWILRHFRESHKSIPLSTRQAISDYSKSLELSAPENVLLPTNSVEPIHGLAIVKGFQCQYTGCSELRSTETSVKQHCWERHEWKAGSGIHWCSQTFQSFFNGPHRK